MVVDAYNPSTEAKPRGSQGPDQSELHSETLSLSHTHKKKPQNNLKIITIKPSPNLKQMQKKKKTQTLNGGGQN